MRQAPIPNGNYIEYSFSEFEIWNLGQSET